ncbi:MAG: hypothetical protein NZ805_05420 [Armatimonadetes bacterium]|nr:hypothetical protein [Armatimonadota bacterium]MDW8028704.1 hypothetical protein [Armatimonadota bacterium]
MHITFRVRLYAIWLNKGYPVDFVLCPISPAKSGNFFKEKVAEKGRKEKLVSPFVDDGC